MWGGAEIALSILDELLVQYLFFLGRIGCGKPEDVARVELPKGMFCGKARVPVGTPGFFNYLFFRV